MKLASVSYDGQWRAGVVKDNEVAVLDAEFGTVDDVVRGGSDAVAAAHEAARRAICVSLDEALLGPPLRRFNRDILCTGWNFWDHFEESRGRREGQDPRERPKHPAFFTKGPDTVIGPYDYIAYDETLSQQWDYEAEIAVVIGRSGRSIPTSRAHEYIFGYLVVNDVSQRDLQRAYGGQWFKGKSVDKTMPTGPWVTTADEVPVPDQLRIRCELNGEVVQEACTSQMAFSIPELIAELSWGMTLRAGDMILTGTPSGVGNGRNPPRFLSDGDLLVTSVSGLGELRNRVVRSKLT